MLLPRAAVTLATIAASAVVLTACGASTGASQDPSQDPSVTIPSSVGAASSTPSEPTPTTSAAAPTPSGPTTTPTTTPTSATTSPSASTRPTAAVGKVLDFQGIHLMLPVESSDLPGIPQALRTALAAGLKQRWDKYGDAPACQKGPVYVVNKVDTAGWASIDTWDDPSVTGPKCAGVGGGYTAFWAVVNGTWQEVVATQQLPSCATFAKYRFPVSIAGDRCAAPDGSEVTYSG